MKKLISIIILSLISIWNAIYLTIAAFNYKAWVWQKLACDINSYLSCSELFSHDFTWILGYPFAMLALFVYIFIIIISLLGILKKCTKTFEILLVVWISWMLFNSYIIANEIMIKVFCLTCMLCSLSITAITIISIFWIIEKRKLSKKEINPNI